MGRSAHLGRRGGDDAAEGRLHVGDRVAGRVGRRSRLGRGRRREVRLADELRSRGIGGRRLREHAKHVLGSLLAPASEVHRGRVRERARRGPRLRSAPRTARSAPCRDGPRGSRGCRPSRPRRSGRLPSSAGAGGPRTRSPRSVPSRLSSGSSPAAVVAGGGVSPAAFGADPSRAISADAAAAETRAASARHGRRRRVIRIARGRYIGIPRAASFRETRGTSGAGPAAPPRSTGCARGSPAPRRRASGLRWASRS